MNEAQRKFLNAYLSHTDLELGIAASSIKAGFFCSDEENANLCAKLILNGVKTATCSMKYWYESGLEPMPKKGDLQIVTDWTGNPVSIIETIEVSECKFSDITAEFAAQEGEGDKSLAWWRRAHWAYFAAECEEQGIKPGKDMVLVLEKFKVVYS